MSPPIIIESDEIDCMVDILVQSLDSVAGEQTLS